MSDQDSIHRTAALLMASAALPHVMVSDMGLPGARAIVRANHRRAEMRGILTLEIEDLGLTGDQISEARSLAVEWGLRSSTGKKADGREDTEGVTFFAEERAGEMLVKLHPDSVSGIRAMIKEEIAAHLPASPMPSTATPVLMDGIGEEAIHIEGYATDGEIQVDLYLSKSGRLAVDASYQPGEREVGCCDITHELSEAEMVRMREIMSREIVTPPAPPRVSPVDHRADYRESVRQMRGIVDEITQREAAQSDPTLQAPPTRPLLVDVTITRRCRFEVDTDDPEEAKAIALKHLHVDLLYEGSRTCGGMWELVADRLDYDYEDSPACEGEGFASTESSAEVVVKAEEVNDD